MGKLDQLKKIQNKQQTAAIDLLKSTNEENVFDEEKNILTKDSVKTKTQHSKAEHINNGQSLKNKKCNVIIPDGRYKSGTIRVPEDLYNQIEKLVKGISNLTYTHFANQSIINCLNCDYKFIMNYNEQKVVIKAKNENFNLFASSVQKNSYKVLPFNLPIKKYEEALKIVETSETITSMNDFFVNCLYTQLEQCKE